jgi:hypothetical protein
MRKMYCDQSEREPMIVLTGIRQTFDMSRIAYSVIALTLAYGCDAPAGSDSRDALPQNDAGDAAPSAAQLAKASALWTTCVGDESPQNRLNRILGTVGPRSALDRAFANSVTCLAASSDGCAALSRCAGVAIEDAPDGCSAQCGADGTLTQCIAAKQVRLACNAVPALGRCDALAADCVDASLASCIGDVPTACESGSVAACVGTLRVHGPACASLGLHCATDPLHGPACVSGGALCTPTFADALTFRFEGQACAGPRLVSCPGGESAELDCSKLDPTFSCREVAAGASTHAFCGTDNACDPRGSASCIGDNLTLCVSGARVSFDCKTLGFAGCDVDHGCLGSTPTIDAGTDGG